MKTGKTLGGAWAAATPWLKPLAPATAFVLCMGLLELTLLHVPYKDLAWMAINRVYARVALHLLLALSGLAGLVAFVTLARLSGPSVRAVAFSLASICLLYEYGYQQTLNRYSSGDDLVIAFFVTNAEHKLDAIFTYLQPLPFVSVLALACTIWSGRKRGGVGARHWILFALLACAWGSAAWFAAINFPVLSLPNTVRSLAAFGWTELTSYRGPRDRVAAKPTHRSATNLLFVVDEAVDGGHLSANGYSRPTTPFLADLVATGRLKTWGEAVAGSTCSHASGILMYTGLQMSELPDRNGSARKVSNLFQWAKAAGYRTYFLDGQMASYWIGPVRDLADVDEWHPASEFGPTGDNAHLADIKIAKLAREILLGGEKRFVFIWKAGLHYPYHRRFPKDSAPWKPYWAERSIRMDQMEALVNAYDNGILWSTDGFFRELLGSTASLPPGSVFLYTSDHGQSLGRAGHAATHCGTGPSEVIVPLMLFGSEKAPDESYRASHANVFGTLLDLMGFEPPSRYGTSLLRAKGGDSAQRFFIGPDIVTGTPIAFEDSAPAPRRFGPPSTPQASPRP